MLDICILRFYDLDTYSSSRCNSALSLPHVTSWACTRPTPSAYISTCISHSEKVVMQPACEIWASISPWKAKVEYMNTFLCVKPLMFWPRSSVISISLEATDLWIEPRDRFSTLDQWVSYLSGWITRHFLQSFDFQMSLCAWAMAHLHFILCPITQRYVPIPFLFLHFSERKTGARNAWVRHVAKVG